MSKENRMSAISGQAASKKRCPECGDKMRETDRCNEDGALFIWHESSKNDCDGQWLEKASHERVNGFHDRSERVWSAYLQAGQPG